MPTLDLERQLARRFSGRVAGVDEAGRGPWAGPVVAAAVVLDEKNIPAGIADSKALTEAEREHLYAEIEATSAIGVGIADVARIDRDNILHATMWAMQRAVADLDCAPVAVLVDGNRAPDFGCPSETVVKGDARCLSIAAASIIAKVTRDRAMIALGQTHPEFGFERHKGYGTPQHQKALAECGVTPHHRRSFRPIQLALGLS
ncbi:MAG: ribonuclease HII [Pseudomonadota bacterium]